MRQKAKRRTAFGILCVSAVLVVSPCIAPILAELADTFTGASPVEIQTVLTVTMLSMTPFSLISGLLTMRFGKKNVLVSGCIMMLLGGVMPFFLNSSLALLYTAMAILGAGQGIVLVISSCLISDYYHGLEKSKMMGFQSAVVGLSGALLAALSGKLTAECGWRYAFLVFLILIPVLIIVFITIPDDSNENEDGEDREKVADGLIKILSGKYLYWLLMLFICGIFSNAFTNNVAMLVDERGLGGAAVSGLIVSLMNIIGIAVGLILSPIVKLAGRHTFILGTAIQTVGFILMFFASSVWMAYLATVIFGIGYAVRVPVSMSFTAYLMPAGLATLGLSVAQAFMSVSGFVSPPVLSVLSPLFGRGTGPAFAAAAAGMLLVTVVLGIYNPLKSEDMRS